MGKMSADYHRDYYHAKVNKSRKMEVQAERRKRISEEVREIKAARGCSLCGFSHPDALHFHHQDPDKKEFNVGDAARKGLGMERIMSEIEKCDVVCANCHAILEAQKRQGRGRQ